MKRNPFSVIGAVILLILPFLDLLLPQQLQFAALMRPIFIFAILALGLNVVAGYTGLLNLGSAAFMAIGAYSFAILSCDIYPFQLGFIPALLLSGLCGAIFGVLLGLPTLRLRGDYLAIVTLGFGEIVQDVLRNLEEITRGTQGINPLPPPTLFSFTFAGESYRPWYYLLLAILAIVVMLIRNIERSRVGRSWMAIREDELAAGCMGIEPVGSKLLAFSIGAALCGIAGALWACYLGSSGEPGNYDFQISIIALCSVIVGGMGSIRGVLLGTLLMVGLNSIVLVKISQLMSDAGIGSDSNVLGTPNNWKYLLFGLALVIMMRFRPHGLLPARSS